MSINYRDALMVAIDKRREWKVAQESDKLESWNRFTRTIDLIAMAFDKDKHAVFADVINAYNNDWNWVK